MVVPVLSEEANIRKQTLRRLAVRAFLRWKIAPDLLSFSDEGVQRHYNSRLSDCRFLLDEAHYERPRINWMLQEVRGGTVLEIGAGNGGMTALLSPLADKVIALDLCQEAVKAIGELGLGNVETVCGFVERYSPSTRLTGSSCRRLRSISVIQRRLSDGV